MAAGDGVHPRGGLIQENNVGVPQQGTRHTEPALHATCSSIQPLQTLCYSSNVC